MGRGLHADLLVIFLNEKFQRQKNVKQETMACHLTRFAFSLALSSNVAANNPETHEGNSHAIDQRRYPQRIQAISAQWWQPARRP